MYCNGFIGCSSQCYTEEISTSRGIVGNKEYVKYLHVSAD